MVEEGGVGIRLLEGAAGLRISDRIERRSVDLQTGGPVDPEPAEQDEFPYPVDAAVEFTADQIKLSKSPAIHIYDADEEPLAGLQEYTTRNLGDGTFFIQFETILKVYIRFEGPLTIKKDPTSTTVSMAESATVLIGVRRHHDRPVGTITTTKDPRDVLRALSHLGSALMTTGPRRSYPSLRGHPPTIELGDTFSVPERIDHPEAGISIEIPPDLARAYVAAPLALYLPAKLVPGETTRIVTDEGFELGLEEPRGYEREVERILKQTFFLDCIAREEITTATTVEQEEVADRLPFAIDAVAELPPAARLERYLEMEFATISEFVPTWKLVAHVQPSAKWVEVLPYLMDDLAVIATPPTETRSRTDTISSVGRHERGGSSRSIHNSRSTADVSDRTFHEIEDTDSVEQAWVGDGIPIGASKAVPEAFSNRTSREESDDRQLRIDVVCNDDGMLEEGFAVGEVYGSREELPFDVSIHKDLSRERFRGLLTGEADFLHYVGHIDETGFECSDGSLDVAGVRSVSVGAFVLNACHSYEQGLALIQGGAIGGVVTLDDVINSGAIRVGKTMARLLNLGFPLRAALSIARQRSIIGPQYLVVGEGNFDIAHKRGLGTALAHVASHDDGFTLSLTSYPTRIVGLGGTFRPAHDEPGDEWFLAGSQCINYHLTGEELMEYLDREVQPVLFDGELTWSDEVELEELS